MRRRSDFPSRVREIHNRCWGARVVAGGMPIEGDALNKLVRRGYWMDMNDRTLVMVMIECAEFSFHLF